MIETIVTKIGLPVLLTAVSESLKKLDNPAAEVAASALDDVEKAMQSGGIAPESVIEANRHIEKMLEIEAEENRVTLSEINQSLRAEIASEDKFVRRMRPTFGYIMALTWAAQMFGIAYVIVFKTENAGFILSAMSSLSAIWGVGLSVLGIYVYKRSEEKRGTAGAGGEHIFWNAAHKAGKR